MKTPTSRYLSPYVRELEWVLGTPSLLAAAASIDGAIPAGTPAIVSDSWCADLLGRSQDLLASLERDPMPLKHFLDRRIESPLLGLRFEALMEFWLQSLPSVSDVYSRLQVSSERGGNTLGEFDFVFRDDERGRHIHWETAVKFYLQVDGPGEIFEENRFLGPDPRDRLHAKVSRMLNHQGVLSRTPEGVRTLAAFGIESPLAELFVKGILFYPWKEERSTKTDGEAEPGSCGYLSDRHLRGWWLRAGDTSRLLQLPDTRSWILLDRSDWLRVYRAPSNDGLLTPRELRECMDSFFRGRKSHGAMIARIERHPVTGLWEETERGLVIYDRWPQMS